MSNQYFQLNIQFVPHNIPGEKGHYHVSATTSNEEVRKSLYDYLDYYKVGYRYNIKPRSFIKKFSNNPDDFYVEVELDYYQAAQFEDGYVEIADLFVDGKHIYFDQPRYLDEYMGGLTAALTEKLQPCFEQFNQNNIGSGY